MDPTFATYQARLDTFGAPKSKSRRPSARGKKAAPKAPPKGGWPLSFPRPDDLAYAGFIFKPTSVSHDNVQCFNCQTQLDGWEETDTPAYEHLTHSPNCGFAINACIRLRSSDPGRTEDDPLSEAMLDARRQTFANLWPLNPEEGYPSIEQMVHGGWYYDPTMETPDGASCPYCCLSLDSWDIGDDPIEEHRKRSAECLFFTLKEFYHPAQPQKARATRGKRASSTSSTSSKKAKKTTRTKKGAAKELNKPLPPPPDETGLSLVADSFGESLAVSTMSTSSKAPAKRTRKAKNAPMAETSRVESFAESFAESTTSVAKKAPARKGRKPKYATGEEEKPAESFATSFADSIASTTSKATKGRKPRAAPKTAAKAAPKAAPKRVSAVSVASTARTTRGMKRKSDEMEVEPQQIPSPRSSPKRVRLSDISMPEFESTPLNTPREVRQLENLKSPIVLRSPFPMKTPAKSPLRAQPQTPQEPQTPEGASSSIAKWRPIVISEIFSDANFEKENVDIDMTDTENMADAVLASLTSPEKRMTVEEFVLHNAKRGEQKLRRECQRQIAAFEAEARRALATLDAY